MSEIKEIKNELLKESYFEIKHDSGLRIFVYPKAGYKSAYAVFGTNYGSIDTTYKREDRRKPDTIPEGCAHFLEHKLFESEDLDAFDRFAKTGASANAFTSFDKTCYLFSCSGDIDGSLSVLLDFVQSPYFTEKTVSKEQGIIGQEIKMYKDSPDWEVLFRLLEAMYIKHPVRIDIAGTTDTIAQITAEKLYDCYETFYDLDNMALAVAGAVSVQQVLDVCDRSLKKSGGVHVSRVAVDEPPHVKKTYTEEKLPVAIPTFLLGYKETYDRPMLTLKEKACTEVILQCTCSVTSPLYRSLSDEGLINDTFSSEYFTGWCYNAVLIGGESKDPKKAASEIKNALRAVKKEGISKEDFERCRRLLYGRAVMSFNDVDGLGNDMVSSCFENNGIFDILDIYKNMTYDDVMLRLTQQFDETKCALSVISPSQEK
jgi:predicted Zn-dependent peptidase